MSFTHCFRELRPFGDKSPAWLFSRKLCGGGPLTDLGVYCLNTCRWLVDEDPISASGAVSWVRDRRRYKEVEEGITFPPGFPRAASFCKEPQPTARFFPRSFMFTARKAGRNWLRRSLSRKSAGSAERLRAGGSPRLSSRSTNSLWSWTISRNASGKAASQSPTASRVCGTSSSLTRSIRPPRKAAR